MHGIRRVVLMMAGAAMVGCSTLQPTLGATPEVGSRVAFDVNDAGRVALGGAMGPEIAQIEGQLIGREGENYLLSVTLIRLLRGGEQVWGGEQVTLRPEYLGTAYERRPSLGRSIALGVVTVGGFTAFLVSRSLFGLGNTDDDPIPPDSAVSRLGRP